MEPHADRYARDSRLSQFDPRVKLVCVFSLVVLVATLTDVVALAYVALFALCLVALSGVPPVHMAKGYALALPFILFASLTMFLTSGAENALNMGLRMSTSILLLLVLVYTTPFMDLLWTMRWFRVPTLLRDMIMFTYRFIFVMLDESDRMRLARRSRGFKGGRSLLDRDAFKVLSNSIGMIFLRSYRRANHVYSALLSRGYDGHIRTLTAFRLNGRDAAMGLAFVLIFTWTLSQQMGWYTWP